MSNLDGCNPQCADVDNEGDTIGVSTTLCPQLVDGGDLIRQFITVTPLEISGYGQLNEVQQKINTSMDVCDNENNEALTGLDNALDNNECLDNGNVGVVKCLDKDKCGIADNAKILASHDEILQINGLETNGAISVNELSGLEFNDDTYNAISDDEIYVSDSDIFMSDDDSEYGDGDDSNKSRCTETRESGGAVLCGARGRRNRRPGVYQVGVTTRQDDLSFRAYVNGTIKWDESGENCPRRIMLDSGNLIPNGVAISDRFLKEAGVSLVKRMRRKCNTAKENECMYQIGESTPLSIRLPGFSRVLHVPRPVVLTGLADDVNIGGGALQRWGVDLQFRSTGTTLKDGQGTDRVPLVSKVTPPPVTQNVPPVHGRGRPICVAPGPRSRSPPPTRDSLVVPLKVRGEQTLHAHSLSFIKMHGWGQGTLCSVSPLHETATCLAVDGLYRNVDKIAVINLSDTPVKLHDGQVIAKCQRAIVVESEATAGGIADAIKKVKNIHGVKEYDDRAKCQDCIAMKEGECELHRDIECNRSGCISRPKHSWTNCPYKWSRGDQYRCLDVRCEGEDIEWHNDEECPHLKNGPPQYKRTPPQVTPTQNVNKTENKSEQDAARMEDIITKLKLRENPVLSKNPEILKEVIELVTEYNELFSEPGDPGVTDKIEFNITLKEGSKPVKAKTRPLNPKQMESLRAQLDVWEKNNVIAPSHSPWASAMVAVRKSGQERDKVRWCVDYRYLNQCTIPDSYPLPRSEDNLRKLEGCRYFSALDANAAYHCIRVGKSTQPLLSFTTPWGLFTFTRLPFGPSGGPACFARFMQMVIGDMRSPHVSCYLDDVLLSTKDLRTHLTELRALFEAHRVAGLRLNVTKTHLFTEETDYLGYHVSARGIELRKDYVDQILNWPSPQSPRDVRRFVGFASYYRESIPRFAALTAEMNAIKNKRTLVWTDALEKDFQELKQCFNKYPVRSHPMFGPDAGPFILTTDYSKKCVSAILSQMQNGEEKFLGCRGRKCSEAEARYGSTKGELAAVIHGVRRYEDLLRYKQFVLVTDNKALCSLHRLATPTALWKNWLAELSSFDFVIQHRSGVNNTNADHLSRAEHLPEASEDWEGRQAILDEAEEFTAGGTKSLAERCKLCAMNIGAPEPPAALEQSLLIRSQDEDDVLRVVKGWIRNGERPTSKQLAGGNEDLKSYRQILEKLEITPEGLLVLKYRLNRAHRMHPEENIHRVCIPKGNEAVMDQVYHWSHRSPMAGHFGEVSSTARCCERFFFPGLSGWISRKVRQCSDCLAKRKTIKNKDCEYNAATRTGYPSERVYCDLVGPLTEVQGYKYILTLQDSFSKMAFAYPIRSKDPEVVANAIIDKHISHYGCMAELKSDCGGEFQNKLWAHLCDRLQIRKTFTPAGNPNSNLVERFHRTLSAILRAHLERGDPEWVRLLPIATLAYNTRVHSSTGLSPFECWMGRRCRLPVDLILPPPGRRYENANAYVAETVDRFSKMYAYMRENQEASFARSAKLYTGSPNKFQVEDLVWCWTNVRVVQGGVLKSPKFTSRWAGPYIIVAKHSDVLVDIQPLLTAGKPRTVHLSRLATYYGPRDTKHAIYPSDEDPIADGGDEMGEIIATDGIGAEDLTTPVKFIPTPVAEIQDLPHIGTSSQPLPTTPKRNKGGDKPTGKAMQKSPPATTPPDILPSTGAVRKQPKRVAAEPLQREGKSSKTVGEKRKSSAAVFSDPEQDRKKLVRDRQADSDISSDMGDAEHSDSAPALPQDIRMAGRNSSRKSLASTKTTKSRESARDRSRSPTRPGVSDYLRATSSESEEDRLVHLGDRVIKLQCDDTTDCKEKTGDLGCTLTSAQSVAMCKVQVGAVPQVERAAAGGVSKRVFNVRSSRNVTVRAGSRLTIHTGLQLSLRPQYGLLITGTRNAEQKGVFMPSLFTHPHSQQSQIRVTLINTNQNDFEINKGQIIGRAIVLPLCEIAFITNAVDQ